VFTLIDRYIAKIFIVYFLAGLVVFVTLFVAVDFISQMAEYNAPGLVLAHYYLLYTPWVVYQLVPVACLLGTIFTLSTLSRHNELVALFSSGMSLARISAPILLLVVFISGLSFWMGDRILPIFMQKKNYVMFVEIRKQPGLYSTVKTNAIWYRTGNVLFNIKTLQPEKNHAQGLTMYYFDGKWKLIQLVTAQEVDLKGATWVLNYGSVTLFTSDDTMPMTQNFSEKVISVAEDVADLKSTSASTEVLSLAELAKFIQRNKEAGLDTLRYEVDYQSKFSFAFAAFVMSFLGIPFSVGKARSGGSALNVGICVGLAFLYYAFYSSGITLGQYGVLPPLIAAWVPNITMTLASAFFLLRLKR
jgi:lipopolysaccharide export system permease protein